jgi:hypothetical protein
MGETKEPTGTRADWDLILAHIKQHAGSDLATKLDGRFYEVRLDEREGTKFITATFRAGPSYWVRDTEQAAVHQAGRALFGPIIVEVAGRSDGGMNG